MASIPITLFHSISTSLICLFVCQTTTKDKKKLAPFHLNLMVFDTHSKERKKKGEWKKQNNNKSQKIEKEKKRGGAGLVFVFAAVQHSYNLIILTDAAGQQGASRQTRISSSFRPPSSSLSFYPLQPKGNLYCLGKKTTYFFFYFLSSAIHFSSSFYFSNRGNTCHSYLFVDLPLLFPWMQAYGIVWKALDKKTGSVVAVKKIFGNPPPLRLSRNRDMKEKEYSEMCFSEKVVVSFLFMSQSQTERLDCNVRVLLSQTLFLVEGARDSWLIDHPIMLD